MSDSKFVQVCIITYLVSPAAWVLWNDNFCRVGSTLWAQKVCQGQSLSFRLFLSLLAWNRNIKKFKLKNRGTYIQYTDVCTFEVKGRKPYYTTMHSKVEVCTTVFFTILMIGPIKNVHQVRYAWHRSVQVVHNVHFRAVKRTLIRSLHAFRIRYTVT